MVFDNRTSCWETSEYRCIFDREMKTAVRKRVLVEPSQEQGTPGLWGFPEVATEILEGADDDLLRARFADNSVHTLQMTVGEYRWWKYRQANAELRRKKRQLQKEEKKEQKAKKEKESKKNQRSKKSDAPGLPMSATSEVTATPMPPQPGQFALPSQDAPTVPGLPMSATSKAIAMPMPPQPGQFALPSQPGAKKQLSEKSEEEKAESDVVTEVAFLLGMMCPLILGLGDVDANN